MDPERYKRRFAFPKDEFEFERQQKLAGAKRRISIGLFISAIAASRFKVNPMFSDERTVNYIVGAIVFVGVVTLITGIAGYFANSD